MRGISIMEFKRGGDWKADGKSRPTSEAARGELSVLANQKALSDQATNQTSSFTDNAVYPGDPGRADPNLFS